MRKYFSCAIVLVFASAFALRGAENFRLLDAKAAINAAAKVTRKNYPDADVALVSDYEKVRYNPDGTSVTTDDFYEKILTEKGRRESREMSLHYMLPYSKIRVLLLELIKPDGTIIKIDPAKVCKIMVDPSQMGQNIYNPNSKILKVTAPGLKVGDTLHVIYRQQVVHPRMKNIWCDFFSLQSKHPIVKYVIEVDAPAARPLQKIALKDKAPGSVTFSQTKSGKRIIYKWTAKNIPRIFEEPSMPPFYMYTQRLLVSTASSWQDISKWYWNLCKPRMDKITPAMKAKVAELTAGLKTPKEKMRAIFQFVAGKIRYMGITTEKEAPGYEPHDVSITFENRYGVCRDKAALLAAMLRLAGIKAFPVLFYNGPKKDPEVPNNYFNHAICCAELKKDQYTLMDPTDETTAKILPSYLSNRSYVVAKLEGKGLMTSPVIPAAKNMMLITTDGKINSDATLSAKTIMRFQGVNDGVYRGAFARWRQDERKQFFARALKSVAPGAELLSLKITPANLFDMKQPLRAEITYSAPNWTVGGKGMSLLPLPWCGNHFGVVNFMLRNTGLKKRRFPLKLYSTCGVRDSFNLTLPGNCTVAKLPQYGNFLSPEITWRQQVNAKGKTISGTATFQINVMEFSPKQYQTLKQTLKKIEYAKRKMPALKINASDLAARFPAADAIILSDVTQVTVKSSASWTEKRTIKKKILNYAGVKANSELRLSYNPAWEKVTDLTAVVTGPDGKRKALGKTEINIMDQGWVGAAPRYPPGKVTVASFPGVKAGATIEYTVETEYFNQPFIAGRYYLRGNDPIISKYIKVRCPKSINLSANLCNKSITGKMSLIKKVDKDGFVNLTATAKNVPRIAAEPALPPAKFFVPNLFISSADYSQYAMQANTAFEQAISGQTMAKKLAENLAKTVTPSNDKWAVARKIRDYVAINIRPAGPAFNQLPLNGLTAADRTLRDGYGNSADRAILLCAMLRAVGFDAAPVPTGPAAKYMDSYLPAELMFPAVLVKVKETKGFFDRIKSLWNPKISLSTAGLKQNAVIYLNDTNQYAKLGALAHTGDIGLNLKERTLSRLSPLYCGNRGENRFACRYDIKPQADGSAEITRTVTNYGAYYEEGNQRFTEMTPEKRKRYFQQAVARISQSAMPQGKLLTNFKIYPGSESFTVKVPQFAVREGRYLYFRLPGNILKTLFNSGEKQRLSPYFQSSRLNMTLDYQIALPKSFKKLEIAPPSQTFQLPSNAGVIIVASKLVKKMLTVKFEIQLKKAIIPASRYWLLENINAAITNQTMKLIMLELTP